MGALWLPAVARGDLVTMLDVTCLGDQLMVLEPSLHERFDFLDCCIGLPCGGEIHVVFVLVISQTKRFQQIQRPFHQMLV